MAMRIGIDISQIVYEGTGVGTYVRRMVEGLLKADTANSYVLFGSSFRRKEVFEKFYEQMKKFHPDVSLVSVAIPPILLDLLWNKLHIMPVEKLTGPLDIFWSSDWTQPPLVHAKGITTIHDLSPMLFPKETDARIRETHARRLDWVRVECDAVFCDSQSTKKDVLRLLHIPAEKLRVIYPGFL